MHDIEAECSPAIHALEILVLLLGERRHSLHHLNHFLFLSICQLGVLILELIDKYALLRFEVKMIRLLENIKVCFALL